MGSVWHFFVAQGGLRALVYVVVGTLAAAGVRAILRELRQIRSALHELRQIARLLDTSEPGGLADVLNALKAGRPGNGRRGAGGA